MIILRNRYIQEIKLGTWGGVKMGQSVELKLFEVVF